MNGFYNRPRPIARSTCVELSYRSKWTASTTHVRRGPRHHLQVVIPLQMNGFYNTLCICVLLQPYLSAADSLYILYAPLCLCLLMFRLLCFRKRVVRNLSKVALLCCSWGLTISFLVQCALRNCRKAVCLFILIVSLAKRAVDFQPFSRCKNTLFSRHNKKKLSLLPYFDKKCLSYKWTIFINALCVSG